MSKRAIRTSRKRVNAILNVEVARRLNRERERIREEEQERAGMIGVVRWQDDYGRVWLTAKPPRHGYVQIPAPIVPRLYDRFLADGGPRWPRAETILTFRAVIKCMTCANGAEVCWTNWEPCP